MDSRNLKYIRLLSLVAILGVAYFGKPVLMPFVAAFILYLLTKPLMKLSRKVRIPQFISAGTIVIAVFFTISAVTSYFVQPLTTWVEKAPEDLLKVQEKVERILKPISKLEKAADKLNSLSSGAEVDDDLPVAVDNTDIKWFFFNHTSDVISSILLTLSLLLFMLLYGGEIIAKSADLFGNRSPTKDKNIILDLERSVSSYLLTVTAINTILGIVIGLTMWVCGLNSPWIWGGAAMVLNFIPYIGPIFGTLLIFIASFISFDSYASILIPPIAYLSITALEGQLITPIVLGARFNLNPLVVFTSMIVWGWLWGLGGALLAVPLLIIFTSYANLNPNLRNWSYVIGLTPER